MESVAGCQSPNQHGSDATRLTLSIIITGWWVHAAKHCYLTARWRANSSMKGAFASRENDMRGIDATLSELNLPGFRYPA